MHLTSVIFAGSIVAALASLMFRDDLGFSPLFCVLLWGNSHYAAHSFSRTIIGILLIIAQALVWILYLEKDANIHLRNQTLSYIFKYYLLFRKKKKKKRSALFIFFDNKYIFFFILEQ